MTNQEKLIQVVRYKCCNEIFAACIEPYCYSESDWQKDLRKYIKQGHKVEMIKGGVEFGECKCIKIKKVENANQIKLF